MCPSCQQCNITLVEAPLKKQGLSTLLTLKCSSCDFAKENYSSRRVNKNKSFDINLRIVYTMRACGLGYAGIQNFTSLMNMPSPMTANNYDKLVKIIAPIVKNVAMDTMSDAVEDLKDKVNNNNDILDTAVSVDGTWQRRGYCSLNGVVTAISVENGKVIDTEVMSRKCKACGIKDNIKNTNPEQYERWKASHVSVCGINYQGSAPGMECEGAKRIFDRSIERHGLRYTQLLGDGDSKSFATVKKTYENVTVEKLECVGHVQKRVGTRIRTLKKDNRGYGGKGKLTNATVDKLQNYYGIAIRSNSNDLPAMKKAVLATLFHVASSSKHIWHDHCPRGADSWCRFQQDKATGNSTFKPGSGLPLSIVEGALKPIYRDLSSDDLLSKCLHGKTQNRNESFNGMIWDRIPKSRYCAYWQLQFGVYDAIANFNIGRKASVLIYEQLEMIPGLHLVTGCNRLNRKRLYHADYKNCEPKKKQRKIIRGLRKSKQDKNKETEGKLYKPGGF